MIQLQLLIDQLEKDANYFRALKQAKKNCYFEEAQLKILTPSSVFLFIEKLNNKTSEDQTQESFSGKNIWSNRWHPNEYKHFVWLAFGYFYVKNTPITSFNEEDIQFFGKVFPQKDRVFLQYHLLAMIKQNKSKRQVWSKQESQLLYDLMNSDKYRGKWSDISYRLYFYSNRTYFKSSHKCREMWFNHLNPTVNHHKWSLDQDIRLFQHVSKIGTKWSQISKAMDGVRTQHMVKNRFNSLIKKYSLKYQRYSQKKLAQIIQKDLQGKVQLSQASQSSKGNSKQDQQMSGQIKIEKQEGKQEILFIQSQKIENDKTYELPVTTKNYQNQYTSTQLNKAEQNNISRFSPLFGKNHIQNTIIIPEFKIERQKQLQRQEVSKNLQNYEMDFETMNNIQNQGEAIPIQWVAMQKMNQVELIDYLGVDYEFKPTIFSGTN